MGLADGVGRGRYQNVAHDDRRIRVPVMFDVSIGLDRNDCLLMVGLSTL